MSRTQPSSSTALHVVGVVIGASLIALCGCRRPPRRETPKTCPPSATAVSSGDAGIAPVDAAVVSRKEAEASRRTAGALHVSAGETYLLRKGGSYAALTFTEAYTGKDADGFDITGMRYECRAVNDSSSTLACATATTDVVFERDMPAFGCGRVPPGWSSGGRIQARCGKLAVMWSAPKYLYFKDAEGGPPVEIAIDKDDRLDPFDPSLNWERED